MQEALLPRKYARPTVDVIFKRVFGTEKNKACLISLLNAILNLEIEDLKTQNDKLLEELQMADPTLDLAVSEIEVAKMTPAERHWYEARLAGMSDKASQLEYATKQGMEKGIHRERLERLTKQSQKRFPNLSQQTLAKIFMLNDEQLDQQLDLILDYNSKKEFEEAIAALPVK